MLIFLGVCGLKLGLWLLVVIYWVWILKLLCAEYTYMYCSQIPAIFMLMAITCSMHAALTKDGQELLLYISCSPFETE